MTRTPSPLSLLQTGVVSPQRPPRLQRVFEKEWYLALGQPRLNFFKRLIFILQGFFIENHALIPKGFIGDSVTGG